ncbi:MAG: HD domain-containing protein [Bacteroidales bacterium]|nr:HD domain-containing protein [Bacteroidales bacterium]MDY6170407.1 HD domain-containing protein [Candidatus Cryptobacteroides sp.]
MDNYAKYLKNPVFGIFSEVAEQYGFKAFVIGGYVRDCFLGRSSDDIDVVVEGSGVDFANKVAARLEEIEYSQHKTRHKINVSEFKTYGTAMIKYRGLELEFVGARKESYRKESRNPIVENGSLTDDQLRRDFTINAMAFSLCKEDFGALVDPFGGLSDLERGIIRTPQDPDITFSDDPLRMLRAVRFATKLSTPQLQFCITPECMEAMRRNRNRLQILTRERIAEELNKMLVVPKPSKAFRLMDEAGLLELILPSLTALKGVNVMEGKGHKDNFDHTLKVLDNVAELEMESRPEPNVWLRWAALLHDVGKARTRRYDPSVGWTFHGHEVVGGRMVPKIFSSLKLPLNEKMEYVKKLVELHLRPIALVTEEVTDSAVRRLLFEAGDDIDDLMILCHGDITSKNLRKVERLHANFELVQRKLVEVEEKDAIRNFKNPIDGDYIMKLFGIEPCRTIGELKEYVKEAILNGDIPNEFEAADALMRGRAAELGLVPRE